MIGVNKGDLENYERDQKFLIVTQDPNDENLFRVLNVLTLGEYEVWRCYQGAFLQDIVWICKCPHYKERLKWQNKACKHIIAVFKFLQVSEQKKKNERRCVIA
jgi:hypothetical protein